MYWHIDLTCCLLPLHCLCSESFLEHDPVLISCTCLFISCKTEECPLKNITQLIEAAQKCGKHTTSTNNKKTNQTVVKKTKCCKNPIKRRYWQFDVLFFCFCVWVVSHSFLYGVDHIVRCEFYVLRSLCYDLCVFHPYRPLQLLLNDFQQQQLTQQCWVWKYDICSS